MSEPERRPGDGLVRFAIRHERVLGWLATGWFIVSCAATARFIDLPEIPFLTDRLAIYVSGLFNAGWWGFVHPALERRKAELLGNRTAGSAVDDTRVVIAPAPPIDSKGKGSADDA